MKSYSKPMPQGKLALAATSRVMAGPGVHMRQILYEMSDARDNHCRLPMSKETFLVFTICLCRLYCSSNLPNQIQATACTGPERFIFLGDHADH